ncbi:MAG: hypothetical protein ABSG03_08145 [Bryobacteraceae bacterium]
MLTLQRQITCPGERQRNSTAPGGSITQVNNWLTTRGQRGVVTYFQ